METLADRLQRALGDSYQVERELGGGGMSRLFLAVERSLGRRVVVKLLPPEWASEVSAQRFQREMETMAQLQHPHVVPILAGGARDGLLYYVMPHVAGESLRARLDRQPLLPVDKAVLILREIADALAYAHRHGVVHRDVKPQNILLLDEHAALADFGVARAISAATQMADGTERLTGTGVGVGTPGYMAPEQIAGSRDVDARADVYALGVVAYEMLAGRAPFSGANVQALVAAHFSTEPPLLSEIRPDVPAALAAAVARALSKDPNARFQDAAAFRDALAAGPRSRVTAALPSRRQFAWSAVAVVAAVLIGTGLLGSGSDVGGERAGPPRIAVLPFEIRASSDYAYLGEGMADLLAMKLEDVDQLHSIDPRAVLGHLERAGVAKTPDEARALARRLGATFVVLGQVVEVAGRLHLSAALYDARGNGAPVRGVAEGDASRFFALVDDLGAQLLAGHSRASPARLTRLAAVTTDSIVALKHYLKGESELRAGRFETAVEAFHQAVAVDSSFALAHYRLAVAAWWAEQASVPLQAAKRAANLAGRLSPRDRRLMEAYDALWRSDVRESERRYREIVRDYPDEVEAWYQLGEVVYHYAPLLGRSIAEARDPFEQALALDQTDFGSLFHLAQLALWQKRFVQLDSLVGRMKPDGEQLLYWRTVRAFALRRTEEQARLMPELSRMSDVMLATTLGSVAMLARNPEGAEQLAALLVRPSRDKAFRALGHLKRAELRLTMGRLRAAWEALEAAASLAPALALEHRALFTLLPHVATPVTDLARLREEITVWNAAAVAPTGARSSYAAMHDSVHSHIRLYLLGMVAARLGDLGAAERRAAELARLPAPTSAGALAHNLAQSVRAQAALAAGRHSDALAALEAMRLEAASQLAAVSIFYGGQYERYLLVGLLSRDDQRRDEALAWSTTLIENSLVFAAPAHLLRARIHEATGRRREAAEDYSRFVELWSECDPPLRPRVEEARRRLAALRD